MEKKFIRNIRESTATYTRANYYNHIANRNEIKTVIEAGARDLLDALELEKIYPNATIYSFECNPGCVEVCKHNLQFSLGRIKFFDYAISDREGDIDFFTFVSKECAEHDPGVSSTYQHKNTSNVPMKKINVKAKKLASILQDNNVESVDVLCLDLQGGEYNALKGLDHYITTIKYIITEFDEENYLYAPHRALTDQFLNEYNFVEIYREADTIYMRQ